MVLTNFECWATSSSNDGSITTFDNRRGNLDLFNTTALQMMCRSEGSRGAAQIGNCRPQEQSPQTEKSQISEGAPHVSHLSSNGYYGFAQVCDNNSTATGNSNNDLMDEVRPQQNINPVGRRKRNWTSDQQKKHDGKRFCTERSNNSMIFCQQAAQLHDIPTKSNSDELLEVQMDHDDISMNQVQFNEHTMIPSEILPVPTEPMTMNYSTAAYPQNISNDFKPVSYQNNYNEIIHTRTNIKRDINEVDFNSKTIECDPTMLKTNNKLYEHGCTDSTFINTNDRYDDHLENLFWSLHGGSGRHMLEHLLNELPNSDI